MKQWQNFQALGKVKVCIEQQVRDIASTLENSLDKEHVIPFSAEECAQYAAGLGRIAGVLRMLECHEIALLADEIMGLLEDAAGLASESDAPQITAIRQAAFVALTEFPALLEATLAGQLRHWHELSQSFNSIRKARNKGLVFSSQTLLTRKTVNFRRSFIDNPEHLKALLDQQLKLYNGIKQQLQGNDDVIKSVRELHTLFFNLEVMSRDFRLATLWGLCAAIAEALPDDQAHLENPSVKLLCSFSTIMQMVRDKGIKALNQNMPEEITRKILQALAMPHIATERMLAIKCWFGLDAGLAESRHDCNRQLLIGYNRKDGITKAIRLITERTSQLADQINEQIADDSSALQAVAQLTPELCAVRGAIAALGMEAPAALLTACLDSAPDVSATDDSHAAAGITDYLDRCAQTLYRCELALQGHAEELERAVFVLQAGKHDSTPLTGVKLNVVLEAVKNLEQVVIAINDYAEADWDAGKLSDTAVLLRSAGFALSAVALERAADFCAVTANFVEAKLVSGECAAQDPAFDNAINAFAHVIISAILYMEQLSVGRAENCSRIERECKPYLQALGLGDGAVADDIAGISSTEAVELDASAEYIVFITAADVPRVEPVELDAGPGGIASVSAADAPHIEAGELAMAITVAAEEAVVVPVVESIIIDTVAAADVASAVSEPRESAEASSVEAVAASSPADAATDEEEEIHAIFIEEASELLAQIKDCHEILAADPNDTEALTTLRRSYHTLKGSGRMVGAAAIGALAWRVENLLNNVISGRLQSAAPMLDTLLQVRGRLLGLVADFDARLPSSRDADSVADAIAGVDAFLPEELPAASTQAPSIVAAAVASQVTAEPAAANVPETVRAPVPTFVVEVVQQAEPAIAADEQAAADAEPQEALSGEPSEYDTVAELPALEVAPEIALEIEPQAGQQDLREFAALADSVPQHVYSGVEEAQPAELAVEESQNSSSDATPETWSLEPVMPETALLATESPEILDVVPERVQSVEQPGPIELTEVELPAYEVLAAVDEETLAVPDTLEVQALDVQETLPGELPLPEIESDIAAQQSPAETVTVISEPIGTETAFDMVAISEIIAPQDGFAADETPVALEQPAAIIEPAGEEVREPVVEVSFDGTMAASPEIAAEDAITAVLEREPVPEDTSQELPLLPTAHDVATDGVDQISQEHLVELAETAGAEQAPPVELDTVLEAVEVDAGFDIEAVPAVAAEIPKGRIATTFDVQTIAGGIDALLAYETAAVAEQAQLAVADVPDGDAVPAMLQAPATPEARDLHDAELPDAAEEVLVEEYAEPEASSEGDLAAIVTQDAFNAVLLQAPPQLLLTHQTVEPAIEHAIALEIVRQVEIQSAPEITVGLDCAEPEARETQALVDDMAEVAAEAEAPLAASYPEILEASPQKLLTHESWAVEEAAVPAIEREAEPETTSTTPYIELQATQDLLQKAGEQEVAEAIEHELAETLAQEVAHHWEQEAAQVIDQASSEIVVQEIAGENVVELMVSSELASTEAHEQPVSIAETGACESDTTEEPEVADATTDSLAEVLEVEFRRKVGVMRQYLEGSVGADADGLPISSTSYLIPVHTLYGHCKVAGLVQFGAVVGRLEKFLQDHPYLQVGPVLQALLAGFCDLAEKVIEHAGLNSGSALSVELEHKLDAFLRALDHVRNEMAIPVLLDAIDDSEAAFIQNEDSGREIEIAGEDAAAAAIDQDALVLQGFLQEAHTLNARIQQLYHDFRYDNGYDRDLAVQLCDQLMLLEGAASVAEQAAMASVSRELATAYQQYADALYALNPAMAVLLDKCHGHIDACMSSLASHGSVEADAEELQAQLKLAIQQLVASKNAAEIQIAEEKVEDSLLAVFIEEASEILHELDSKIADWQQAPDDKTIFDDLLRSLHTLKGSAALVGEKDMSESAHRFESCLIDSDRSRTNRDAQFFAEVDRHLHILQTLFALYGQDESGRPVRAPIGEEQLAQLLYADVQHVDEAVAAAAAVATAGSAEPLEETRHQTNERPFAPTTGSNSVDDNVGTIAKVSSFGANAEPAAAIDEHVRVSVNLLKSLLNDADEISIARNRIEQTIADMQILMGDMEETFGRIESSMNSFEFYAKTRADIRQGENGGGKAQGESDNVAARDFDALEMDKYTELQQIVLSLLEDYNDVRDLKNNVAGKIRSMGAILDDQQRSTNKLQEGLLSSQMVPFAGIAPRLRRLVRQVSTDLDKQVTISFDNPEGKVDRSVLQALINPIEHMIRNAVDHGIEAAQERTAAGKQVQGELQVKLYRQGANIILDIIDDGRGINTAKVRQKAIAQGLLAAIDKVTEQELCQFILRAGFSTSDTVSHISGRGVGLDVVQDEISQIGGDIEILSKPGTGTTFRIRLPMTSSLNRALLFSVSGAEYVMLLNTIDGIILEKNETLQRCHSEDVPTFFNYGDKSYELAYLGALLDEQAVPEFQGGITASSSLVLVSGEGKNLALHVDSVTGSRELVVKALGAQFANISVLTGGVILGDGRVVVVLDPRFLVENHMTRKIAPAGSVRADKNEKPEIEFETGKTVMVVDDSITVRKVTSAILKRNGMNVILAKNGMEAVELLQTTKPDVMLLDIEMPKMDGFEVAAYVRRQEDGIRNLPIIMITSRIGDKHRTRAEEIGVNQYMCKPFQEVNLLEAIAGYN